MDDSGGDRAATHGPHRGRGAARRHRRRSSGPAGVVTRRQWLRRPGVEWVVQADDTRASPHSAFAHLASSVIASLCSSARCRRLTTRLIRRQARTWCASEVDVASSPPGLVVLRGVLQCPVRASLPALQGAAHCALPHPHPLLPRADCRRRLVSSGASRGTDPDELAAAVAAVGSALLLAEPTGRRRNYALTGSLFYSTIAPNKEGKACGN